MSPDRRGDSWIHSSVPYAEMRNFGSIAMFRVRSGLIVSYVSPRSRLRKRNCAP